MIVDPSLVTSLGPSFMQTLISDQLPNLSVQLNHCQLDMTDEISTESTLDNFIPLTALDKSWLYSPWQFSLIVKDFGRKINHLTLPQKVMSLWRPIESLSLIDLRNDFFLIKGRKHGKIPPRGTMVCIKSLFYLPLGTKVYCI